MPPTVPLPLPTMPPPATMVIIGHGFEFGDPALEVASTYTDVTFICTEASALSDNVASYVMGGGL